MAMYWGIIGGVVVLEKRLSDALTMGQIEETTHTGEGRGGW